MAVFGLTGRVVALTLMIGPLLAACGSPPSQAPTPAAGQPPAATSAAPTQSAPLSASSPAAATGAASPVAAGSPAATSPGTVGSPVASGSPAASGPSAAAVAPITGPATGGKPGGTFVIASLGPLPKVIPYYPDSATYSSAWTELTGFIFGGGLIEQDANTFEYRPYAAASWTISPDGKTFTFKLRPDLKWSDGQPLTVDDFLYAFQEASKEENDYVGIDNLERIASFTTPDASTIVVTLKETLARDVAIGVASSVYPVPKHIWQGKSWTDPTANPELLKPTVVSGPYIIKDLNQAEGATMERNPYWFRGTANFERIVIKPGQQPTVAYELLKSNQAQWAPHIPPSQYNEAKQNPNLTLYDWQPANAAYRVLDFNLQREFLKDKRVREALSRALNRQDLIQVAENGLGQAQYSFLNPNNTKWYNPNVDKYDFDMNRAKQLLQEAGYTLNGNRLVGADGQQIKLQVLYPVTSNPRQKIAAYMQQQYRQLGIDLEVRGLDALAFFEEQKKKNFDLGLGTWGGGSIDPDLGPKAQLKGDGTQNFTSYDNSQVDQLFKQGAVELDEAKRKQIYDQIQQLVSQDLPSFYLYSLTSFSPMSKQIVGVQTNKLDDLGANDAFTRWAYAQ
ncbi:MAG: hypothetical protein IT305_09250 [Chloroflexi bacterium]|nr:hypothetical protein [Chloroflexota bacterium]